MFYCVTTVYFKIKLDKLCHPEFNVELSINFKYTIQLKQP